jgi:tRNA 2-thiocytidine biosynthesis protein TtcA
MAYFKKKILKAVGQAISDFQMIQDKDHILACLSGGKDSWTMLDVLQEVRRRAPVDFKITAINIDPDFKNYDNNKIAEYCTKHSIEFQIIKTTIREIIQEKKRPGSSFCSFCARLRRGAIYTTAAKLGVTKIALGHHRDDLIETILLNMFFTGQLKSMAPIMKTDDKRHIVIRPLIYTAEEDISRYAAEKKFPIVDCACAKGDHPEQRQKIKKLIKKLETKIPDVKTNILNSLSKVTPSHLLDTDLFDFIKFK